MQNYIKEADLDLVGGILQGTIGFESGLNIISGENGTLKTKLLQSLKNNKGAVVRTKYPQPPLRIQAISPKRNSDRRAAEGIIQFFRQQNRTWDTVLQERQNVQIVDTSFDNYPSLGDLFYLVFEHRTKDGSDRKTHMARTVIEFNEVISSVFPQYELVADWNEVVGAPTIRMKKNGRQTFPIESLSLGEQEVLSLIASMNSTKDSIDVYLIDEPEVHLNWNLEERLFEFIDRLCTMYHKQAIVVTHSRVIFKHKFLNKCQFMHWNADGRIGWNTELTTEQRGRLAGDAIEIVALGNFSRPTFFVEDDAHAKFISILAELESRQVTVTQCGNSPNVKSLFEHQKNIGPWPNSFFMIDGDNQGDPFPNEEAFIHLPVYCVENIFLDPTILAKVSEKSETSIREVLLEVLKVRKSKLFKGNKFFELLLSNFTEDIITYERIATLDGSQIFDVLCSRLNMSQDDLMKAYLKVAKTLNVLQQFVPPKLLGALRSHAIE